MGIFKGPKGALIFMGTTVISVLALVGTEDRDGALTLATDEITRQSPEGMREMEEQINRENAARNADRSDRKPPRKPPPARRSVSPTVFASDAELLDDTNGFDPNPASPEEFDIVEESGEAVITDRNVTIRLE